MHIVLKVLGFHVFFPGNHLIHIAAYGIDLAVMYDKAVRMGAHPAGVCIGAEPGMDNGNGRPVILILKILEKPPQLPYQEHPLIHNGTAAQGDHIRVLIALFKYPAHHVQFPVKVQSCLYLFRLCHKALGNVRHHFQCPLPQDFRGSGNYPPSQKGKPFLFHNDLKHLHCLVAGQLILGKEEHTHAVFPLASNVDAQRFCYFLKKAVGNLQHDTHAVTGFAFSVLTGSVFQIFHNVECLVDCLMCF